MIKKMEKYNLDFCIFLLCSCDGIDDRSFENFERVRIDGDRVILLSNSLRDLDELFSCTNKLTGTRQSVPQHIMNTN